MTTWAPDIRKRRGPRYLAIADVIAEDIESGRLEPGRRLPTHRDLAGQLHVTVGTITRAYLEAARRGLVRGEVGRGTFVRPGLAEPPPPEEGAGGSAEQAFVDLSLNLPVGETDDRILALTLSSLAARRGLSGLLDYQPHAGTARHRASGAAWLARSGLRADADHVLITCGAQHAMAVILSTLASPGDTILAERLAYPGFRKLAEILRLKVKGVEIDEKGLRPDSLEAACRGARPRILYCTPTIQNPTAAVMPEARRREIANVARRHKLIVVEDDIYGLLPPERPRPLASFAPEIAMHVASLSKSIAPGLRIAYVLAPGDLLDRLLPGLRATTWMAAPLMAEIASLWIEDGTAESLLMGKRQEAAERQRMAAASLGSWKITTHPFSYHLWLELPEPWKAAGFAAQALQRGVAVTPADTFVVEGPTPRAVRVCLGAPRRRHQLERGLRLLCETLEGVARPEPSIV